MIETFICREHQREISMLDISDISIKKSRLICPICYDKYKIGTPLSLKNLPERLDSFISKTQEGIREEYAPQVEKLQRIIKLLNTQRNEMDMAFDQLVSKIEQKLETLSRDWQKELQFYQEIPQNINLTKLEEIAEYLSENKQRKPKFNSLREKLNQVLDEIQSTLTKKMKEIDDLLTEIDKITKGSMTTKARNKYWEVCTALVYNEATNTVVGGIGEEIFIWDFEEKALSQPIKLSYQKGYAFSKLYNGNVNAIAISQSGDIMVAGRQDNYITVWWKVDKNWQQVHRNSDHKKGVTCLQLREEYLVSGSLDCSFKMWKLSKTKLECIQDFSSGPHPLFYITISKDFQFMATSGCTQEVNVYQVKKNKKGELNWSSFQSIRATVKIHRIHFTDQHELLCQQVNPPKLTFLKKEGEDFLPVHNIVLEHLDFEQIQFPIFESKQSIFCKNDKFIYIIKRSCTGLFFIEQMISGSFCSGCADASGNYLILGDLTNKEIQVYEQY